MKKSTTLPHRKRNRSARANAKRKAKLRRARLRQSSGNRKFHR